MVQGGMTPTNQSGFFERRRFQAIDLYKKGIIQSHISRKLGVSRQSVSRWVGSYRKKGAHALISRPRSGRPPKLNRSRQKHFLNLLARGPQKFGYTTQLWTSERICRLLKDRFGVQLHPHHVPKLLRQCGWSYQKPATRAKERNEAAINRWVKREWPRIKKKPANSTPPSSSPTSPVSG